MKWPRFAMAAFAILAAVALLLYVSASGEERGHDSVQSAGAQRPSERANHPSRPAGARKDGRADTNSAPEAEQQPAEGEIRVVGRIIYKAPNACEYIATLSALKAGVTICQIMEQREYSLYFDELSGDLADDGKFSLTLNVAKYAGAKPEESPQRLLDPGRQFRVQVGAGDEVIGGSYWVEAIPRIRGRLLDFGDINVSLYDFLPGESWLLTGRISDMTGSGLANLAELSFFLPGTAHDGPWRAD